MFDPTLGQMTGNYIDVGAAVGLLTEVAWNTQTSCYKINPVESMSNEMTMRTVMQTASLRQVSKDQACRPWEIEVLGDGIHKPSNPRSVRRTTDMFRFFMAAMGPPDAPQVFLEPMMYRYIMKAIHFLHSAVLFRENRRTRELGPGITCKMVE